MNQAQAITSLTKIAAHLQIATYTTFQIEIMLALPIFFNPHKPVLRPSVE